MESPRHNVQISENVARMFQMESLLIIQQDPRDESINPLSKIFLLAAQREPAVLR